LRGKDDRKRIRPYTDLLGRGLTDGSTILGDASNRLIVGALEGVVGLFKKQQLSAQTKVLPSCAEFGSERATNDEAIERRSGKVKTR
jgi:hypothetical protein